MKMPRRKRPSPPSRAALALVHSQNAKRGEAALLTADVRGIARDRREMPASLAGVRFAFCNSGRRTVGGRLLRLVAKQQTAALLATLVDYAVMAALASGAGVNPAVATACGALVGTFVGFILGRQWVFRVVDGSAWAQAGRYLAVSLVSLVANAGGEALLVGAGLHYLAARPIISLTVSLGWNLPMQQFFVFRRRPLSAV